SDPALRPGPGGPNHDPDCRSGRLTPVDRGRVCHANVGVTHGTTPAERQLESTLRLYAARFGPCMAAACDLRCRLPWRRRIQVDRHTIERSVCRRLVWR